MRDFTSELLRREIARPLHPRRHGRAALVAAGPCAEPAWTSRAEGGAGTSRADAPRIGPAELFRREIPRPLHPRPHGRAALVAAGPCAALDQHPTHGPATRPPTHGPAREVPEPPSARGVRTGLPRWLALTHEDPDIGRGARPARPPAPHAHARLGCRTPRRAPRRGRAAGDVGPYHSLTRTHLVPTLALRRPRARSTRAALGAGRPLPPTPCVHPMRVPCVAKLSPKNLNFFVIEGCRWHTFMCRASRGYAPRPIKQGESGVSGGVCAACIFGERTR